MVIKFESVFDFLKVLPDEQACIKYFEKWRWKGVIISPFDPNSKVYKCSNDRYKCKNTGKYFNAKTGTIFEGSKIPLEKWFYVLYNFVNHKEGISSHQLARDIGVNQRSAWFMLHRLRLGFESPIFKEILKGIVEIDETFIGGKNKNRHWDKKVPNSQGRSWKDKIPVLGILERGSGKFFAQVVKNTQQITLEPIIRASIEKGSNVYTDEWYRHNNNLSKNFNHEMVNHGKKQYVKEKVHTNTIENRWSHFKPMISGTYRWISRKHSQNYVNEFTLRNNTRKYSRQDRFNLVLSSMIGKHLTYQQLIN